MSPLRPHITPDSFFHTIPSQPQSSSSPPTLIYFISGNPGLISYYTPFLTLLAENLKPLTAPGPGPSHQSDPASDSDSRIFHIHGHSLAGFELSDRGNNDSNSSSSTAGDHYHNLEEQICFVQRKLNAFVRDIPREDSGSSPPKPNVILIGHSVGGYIAMEVINRHLHGYRHRQPHGEQGSIMTPDGDDDNDVQFNITGGVMLFPTVVDIALSPSGRKLTTLLSLIPNLALLVAFLARILTSLLPTSILRPLVASFTAHPPDHALDATCAFLASKTGVRQALHMAADEMKTITADGWADEVWGVGSKSGSGPGFGSESESEPEPDGKDLLDPLPLPQLAFYFGRNDHWVAEETREEILKARGGGATAAAAAGEKNGPSMLVCEEGVPHAFCLRHSEVMARKVAGLVGGIVRGGLD
ncbi:hypothetical protein BO70DRAFT_381698 [Aspergillus heteromorphus CBS 117.55]|uniref:Alpha/beta-hydrolase n=1 Tax=Aspergillus heteromorphus CBS 117.55 TaxID=1448321 RepID=A0A317VEW8_9EURO|nr:uncharacterized protein BO70DRAFT_381698 [Aspergillus heteromorphus CBS 117.55]PWY72906.1 hypothetical protein BO70DRAFT_381698 [Aspergillus heteromorphus CBS 117.55]